MHQINKKSRIIEIYSLLLIDILCIFISYMCALKLRFGNSRQALQYEAASINVHFTVLIYLFLFCVLYAIVADWNRGYFERGNFVEFVAVFKYNLVMMVAVGCLLFLVQIAWLFSRLVFVYFTFANLILTYISHLVFKQIMLKYYRNSNNSDKVMIVIEAKCAQQVVENIINQKMWNYEIVAIAILDENMIGKKICGIPVIASKDSMLDVSRQMMLDEVFLYIPTVSLAEAREIIIDFETMGVVCHYNVEKAEMDITGKTAGRFAGYMVMTFSLQYFDYRRMLIKRFMDLAGGLLGIIITALITPFVALAIKIESPGPVLFSQVRIGKNGRRFKIYKFRSMYLDAEERKKELESQNEIKGLMFKMEDDPRITKVGKFIRKTSIDELPQFINVLKGDMSLVGTRPPTVDEFEQYSLYYRRRMCITPGLTGMWQISGRSDITDFNEVVKLDLDYIDHWSLKLDLKILCSTVLVVLFGRGSK